MKSSESPQAGVVEADIVVIGGGGGLAAAVAAAEKGASVVLLEKRKLVGGNTAMARGMLGAESPVQKRLKIDARSEDLFKTAMDYSHWKINPDIFRAFVNKSGDTIQWLEEYGVTFEDIPNFYSNQCPRIYHVPKGYGAHVVQVLVRKCKELGVKILLETAAKRILTDEEGAAAGILATSRGEEIQISTKSVIISTGGYSGNKELLRRYCSQYTDGTRVYGLKNMGDGLTMGIEAGAATEDLGTLHLLGPFFPGPPQVLAISVESNTIWVNRDGVRFANESTEFPSESANALNRQPAKISYTLFDEGIKRSFVNDGLVKGVLRSFLPGSKLTELDKYLQKEAGKGKVKIADSWRAVAEWIGAGQETLENTINEYNHACDRGYDDKFYKDRSYLVPLRIPPFYAIKCQQAIHGTIGGIKINHRMEVLNRHDKPIPGLYATGNDAGGWASDTYCYLLSGAAFAFAINSARIAGENAVRYISEKWRDRWVSAGSPRQS